MDKENVVSTQNFLKSVDVVLSVLNKHTYTHTYTKAEGHKKTFGGDGYVYYLNCCDGITGSAYVQAHQIIYIKCMQFFSILIKAVGKRGKNVLKKEFNSGTVELTMQRM